jgi:hypothetical protein
VLEQLALVVVEPTPDGETVVNHGFSAIGSSSVHLSTGDSTRLLPLPNRCVVNALGAAGGCWPRLVNNLPGFKFTVTPGTNRCLLFHVVAISVPDPLLVLRSSSADNTEGSFERCTAGQDHRIGESLRRTARRIGFSRRPRLLARMSTGRLPKSVNFCRLRRPRLAGPVVFRTDLSLACRRKRAPTPIQLSRAHRRGEMFSRA